MYTYKVMIHPNNKQATKIRRTLNKCIECQNIVYDYIESFIKDKKTIPSCKEKRKEMTFEEKNASKSITEVANRKFRKLLENRSYKYGVAILIADQYYPSTKKCSCCGQIKKMKIEDRIYECENCGLKLDRDLNAAINLANYVNKNN